MFDEETRKKVVKILCEEWAEQYQQKHSRGSAAAKLVLNDPRAGLKFVLTNGFARAGGEQAGYGDMAAQALDSSIIANGDYDKLMRLNDAPEIVWNNFLQICDNKHVGVNAKVNEGVVKGLVRLAQNSVNLNPFEHLGSKVVKDTLGTFMLLRNILGIGDKVASFITRDIVTILSLEERIVSEYQILLQPVDRWIHGISSSLWNNLGQRAPTWLIALTVVTKCREYRFSPARFNQGAWMYGSSIIVDTKKIPQGMSNLAVSLT
jgi:hypothetical protein